MKLPYHGIFGLIQERPNFVDASLELTVTTLKVVDRTIGFYTNNKYMISTNPSPINDTKLTYVARRGFNTVTRGGDDEADLVESLNDISTKSTRLLEKESMDSHFSVIYQVSISNVLQSNWQWPRKERST